MRKLRIDERWQEFLDELIMENQNQYPHGYTVTPLPAPEKKQEENPEPSNVTVFGALLWVVILLLAFWFITGGWENLLP